jgi:spore maturation protein CgeB
MDRFRPGPLNELMQLRSSTYSYFWLLSFTFTYFSVTLPRILLVSRFGDDPHSHAAMYQRALERLGSIVIPFNLKQSGWLDRFTGKDLKTQLAQAIQHAIPDIVLVTDGEVLREGAVEPLKAQGKARWVHWFPRPGQDGHHIAHAVRASDRVLVAGSAVAAYWSEQTGSPVGWLDPGCDPSVHRPLRVREPFRANVVFAGTATPYREAVLTRLVDFGLAVWGRGWKKSGLKEYCRGEQLSAEDFVRAYAGGTIGINVHREAEGPAPDGALNARLFEIAAIGVPQAVELRRELADHFVPGEEVLTYHGVEELRDKVRTALTDSGLRDRMAHAARQTALQRHTYMHRMRELLQQVTAKQPKVSERN